MFFADNQPNPETMLGSASIAITVVSEQKIKVTIMNVVSITSADLEKHLYWNEKPTSVVRS